MTSLHKHLDQEGRKPEEILLEDGDVETSGLHARDVLPVEITAAASTTRAGIRGNTTPKNLPSSDEEARIATAA